MSYITVMSILLIENPSYVIKNVRNLLDDQPTSYVGILFYDDEMYSAGNVCYPFSLSSDVTALTSEMEEDVAAEAEDEMDMFLEQMPDATSVVFLVSHPDIAIAYRMSEILADVAVMMNLEVASQVVTDLSMWVDVLHNKTGEYEADIITNAELRKMLE
jgi:hypothetical protein